MGFSVLYKTNYSFGASVLFHDLSHPDSDKVDDKRVFLTDQRQQYIEHRAGLQFYGVEIREGVSGASEDCCIVIKHNFKKERVYTMKNKCNPGETF